MELNAWIKTVESFKNDFLDKLQAKEFESLLENEDDTFQEEDDDDDDDEEDDPYKWNLMGAKLVNLAAEHKDDSDGHFYGHVLELDSGREEFTGCLDENGNGHGRLVQFHLTNGLEQKSLEGQFMRGKLQGKVREGEFEWSLTDIYYEDGVRHGFYRKFRWDRKFLEVGLYLKGQKIGLCWQKREGNSYLLTRKGHQVYMYPDLCSCIVFEGLLESSGGRFGLLKATRWAQGLPELTINYDLGEDKIFHDPSTSTRLSKSPVVQDPYEKATVYVKASGISPDAGEGLYARKNIGQGQLVALFNGVKCSKKGRGGTAIKADSHEWSDYRLTLDRAIDLDVPSEWAALDKYKATLGHKACHTFGRKKNSRFESIFHPRFGHIMSVVALREIKADEEILVNYNYDIKSAPEWYKQLWQDHLKDLDNRLKAL